MTPFLQGRVDGLNGLVPSDEERQNHIVEDNHITHGKHGQKSGDGLGLFPVVFRGLFFFVAGQVIE